MKIEPGMVGVITGAAGGIGQAVGAALARRQVQVALADIDEAALQQARRRLEPLTSTVSTYCADISDPVQMERLPSRVLENHPGVDLLVNAAGVSLAGPFESSNIDDLDWIYRINLMGFIYACRFFLPVLRQSQAAHIVNISSDFGLLGFPTKTAYCATKFAVRGFTEALRVELSGSHIGVSCAYPGAVNTGMVQKGRAWDAAKQALEAQFVQSRAIPAEHVAERILRGIERNAPRVLIGRETYLIDIFTRLFPSLYQRWLPIVRARIPFI